MVEENALVRQMRCIVAEKARNASLLETMIIEFEDMSYRLARRDRSRRGAHRGSKILDMSHTPPWLQQLRCVAANCSPQRRKRKCG